MPRVLYIQYTSPVLYPPLEHSSRLFAEKGWNVSFCGIQKSVAKSLRFPDHPRIKVRLFPPVIHRFVLPVHYFLFATWCLWRAFLERPEWIYVSDFHASAIGNFLSRWFRGRVIYHEHDSNMPTSVGKLFYPGYFSLARRAAVNILPNEERLATFLEKTKTARPTLLVYNCPRLEEIKRIKREVSEQVHFVFAGSIGPDRSPLALVQAMGRFPGIRLTVAGYVPKGNESYWAKFTAQARTRMGDGFTYVGPVPERSDLFALFSRATVGLALLPLSSTNRDTQTLWGASNKVFDYLAAGLAVIVPSSKEWKRLVESQLALDCDPSSEESIARAIQQFVDNPRLAQDMGRRGRDICLREWNYEAQFEKVLDCLGESAAHFERKQSAM